jgi:enoyl-CoA hydratase
LADAILTISMNRPKVNAMSVELLNDLEQAFDHASKNDNIKGVHLRSNLRYTSKTTSIIYKFILHFSSTFSAGLDLADMHERCSLRQRPAIDKFVFHTLSRGITAPLHCSKPVACSLDGHAIAGGIILALACDHITMGTRKPFRIGVTELAVGVPFPSIPLEIIRHQLDPQLAHRLVFDANLISSNDFTIRCDRSETPDDLSRKWLKMTIERPLKGFEITKKKWWSDFNKIETADNEQEKKEYFATVTTDDCLQAMKQTLKK